MKLILNILKQFIVIGIFLQSIYADDGFVEKISSIQEIVLNIKALNQKIDNLKVNSADSNNTNIKTLNLNKNEIMLQIPNAIVSHKQSKTYEKEINQLYNKVNLYTKNQDQISLLSTNIELTKVENSQIFYSLINTINNAYEKGLKKHNIQNSIKEASIKLNEKDYVKLEKEINELKTKNIDSTAYEQNYKDMLSDKLVYNEILDFLSSNIELISPNLLMETLNLESLIDSINNKIPHTNFFNTGKIILILIVIAFFYSLKRILAKLIFLMISKITKNNLRDKKELLFEIEKPVGWILIAYSLKICAIIFYYPLLVSPIFLKYFGYTFIVLYAWLAKKIVDSYVLIFIDKISNKGGRKEMLNLIIKTVYFIIIVITVLIILSKAGFNISAIIASLGIGGLAIALATKDIIANFFASILLLFDNSFSQGDWIVIGDAEGSVVEIGLRKTTIRTFDNSLLFIPNSKIIDSNIKNWNKRKVGRMLKITIGLTYDSTKEQILKCIQDIKNMLENHEDIAKEHDNERLKNALRMRHKQNLVSLDDLMGYKSGLNVALDSFGDFSINITLECFTKTIKKDEFIKVKEDILINIMDIVEKNNLSFAFPSQSIYIEKHTTI